jgi:hypothetical protein
VDLFEQINNALLDLQGSQLQTYARPLQTLGRLLEHEDLRALNEKLLSSIDLEDFLKSSNSTGGSMIGSKVLPWPNDAEKVLGLQLALILKMARETDFAFNFSFEFFHGSGRNAINSIHLMVGQLIIPFVRDYKAYVRSAGNSQVRVIREKSQRVFVVHGHDGEAREMVARFLSKMRLDPVILHEQANRGRTIIEKVEANSDVGFAVILLSPDDVGRSVKDTELEPRARQNVLLELGYFIAALGRENVCALKRGELVIPSDFFGVIWTDFDDAGGWKQGLARELSAAGYHIDWNLVMQ